MEIELDFTGVEDLATMHEILKQKFGFPDFYGRNVNALIDCWRSLRYAEDGMTTIFLDKDETLILKVIGLPMNNLLFLNHFLIAVETVNQNYISLNEIPPIAIVLL